MKFTLTSHRKEALNLLERASEKALKTCGGMAESYAKENLRNNHSVQTGLLRNSVTYALGGQGANTSSYSADVGGASGSYSGTAPADKGDEKTVYIGTNVYYAPFVELGTSRADPKPYLRPAAENHAQEYQEVIKRTLSNS